MITIDFIEQLRALAVQSNQKIRMKPGVYRVSDALPEDPAFWLPRGNRIKCRVWVGVSSPRRSDSRASSQNRSIRAKGRLTQLW